MDGNHTVSRKPQALIFVESQVGSGHMQIAAGSARALEQQGFDVTIATSESSHRLGRHFDYGHARVVELPSFQWNPATESYDLTENGLRYEDDPAFQRERTDALTQLIRKTKPELFITESWPFGRRALDAELLPALEQLRETSPQAQYYPLVRDILYYGVDKGDSAQDVVNIVNQHADAVMVTGDQKVVTLDHSFEQAHAITKPILYPGYFVSELPERDPSVPEAQREVLVSTGGGWLHEHMLPVYESAIRSKHLTEMHNRPWRLLVSDQCPATDIAYLQQLAADDQTQHGGGPIHIERFRSDYKDLLVNAAMVISQGGLNTLLEAARTHELYNTPVVIAPLRKNTDKPNGQDVRASLFAQTGHLTVLPPEALREPDQFARLVNHTIATSATSLLSLEWDGATQMAGMLQDACRVRTQIHPRPQHEGQVRATQHEATYLPQK